MELIISISIKFYKKGTCAVKMKHKKLTQIFSALATTLMLAGPTLSTATAYADVNNNPGSDTSKFVENAGKHKDDSYNQSDIKDAAKTKDDDKKGSSDDDKKDKDKTSEEDDSQSDSQYAKLKIPSRLSTAYHDGYQKALADGDSKKDSKASASGSDSKDVTTFKNNIKTILSTTDSFSNVGALIGPIGLSQQASGTDTVAQKSAADVRFLKTFMVTNSQQPGSDDTAGMAYYTFGKAFANTVSMANHVSPSQASGNRVSAALRNTSAKIANIGITLLRYFSPAPVLLALFNETELRNASNGDNLFVKFVIGNEILRDMIHFFGSRAPAPFSRVSNMFMIVGIFSFFMLGFYGFAELFSAGSLIKWLKKTFLKVTIMMVGIPLSMKVYNDGLKLLDNFVAVQSQPPESEALRNNLGLAMWANAGFALPSDTELKVVNDNFEWDEDTVQKINLHSARLLGLISSDQEQHPSNKVKELVVRKMISFGNDKNNATLAWAEPLTEDGKVYHTDGLNALADALGSDEKIDPKSKDINLNAIGYLNNGKMKASGSGDTYTYSQTDNNYWGFSPIAAFNFVNTDFSNTSISVIDNMSTNKIPAVAAQAAAYNIGSAKELNSRGHEIHMPDPVAGIISFVSIIFAIKAISMILTNGFGGLLFGAGRSTAGSAQGVGQLIGGICALVGGLMGIALIDVLVLQAFDFVYGLISELINKIPGISNLNDAAAAIQKSAIGKIPWIGNMIVGLCRSISTLLSSIIVLIFGVSFIRVPLMAFAQACANLPMKFAEAAARMEAKVTGDYNPPSGGGMPGGMAGALAKSAAQQGAVYKQGASMAFGGLKDALSKKDSSNIDNSNKEEDKKNEKDSVANNKDGDNKKVDSKSSEAKNAAEKKNSDSKNSQKDSKKDKESKNDTQNNPEKASDGANNDKMDDPKAEATSDAADAEAAAQDSMTDPDTTENPDATQDPDGTETPDSSDDPSSAQDATADSDDTMNPDTTESDNPDATGNPDDTMNPEQTSDNESDAKDANPDNTETMNPDATESNDSINDDKASDDPDKAAAQDNNPDAQESMADEKTSDPETNGAEQSSESSQENNQEINSDLGDNDEQVDNDQSMATDDQKSTEENNSEENAGEQTDPVNDDVPTSDDSVASGDDKTIDNSQTVQNDGKSEQTSSDESMAQDKSNNKSDSKLDTKSANDIKNSSQQSSMANINKMSDGGKSSKEAQDAIKQANQFADKLTGKALNGTSESKPSDGIATKPQSNAKAASQAAAGGSPGGPSNSGNKSAVSPGGPSNSSDKQKGKRNGFNKSNMSQIGVGLAHMAGGATGTDKLTGIAYNHEQKKLGKEQQAKAQAQQVQHAAQQVKNEIFRQQMEQNKSNDRFSGPAPSAPDASQSSPAPTTGQQINTSVPNSNVKSAIDSANKFADIINGDK